MPRNYVKKKTNSYTAKDLEDYSCNDELLENPYKIQDSVLVRYLIRKKWKYYVGFIEEIPLVILSVCLFVCFYISNIIIINI